MVKQITEFSFTLHNKYGYPMINDLEKSMVADLVLPSVKIKELTDGDGYLIVARDLLQGVHALSTILGIPSRACELIASHALECALKAFLWHRGKKEEIRKPKVQHDLIALWDMVFKEKVFNIPETPPNWVQILSRVHGRNYYFRYQTGEKYQTCKPVIVHMAQTLALIPMAEELSKIIEMVENDIKT